MGRRRRFRFGLRVSRRLEAAGLRQGYTISEDTIYDGASSDMAFGGFCWLHDAWKNAHYELRKAGYGHIQSELLVMEAAWWPSCVRYKSTESITYRTSFVLAAYLDFALWRLMLRGVLKNEM